jgi:hypothetical protein
VWLIDEYVRIFYNDVWFISPSAPTTTGIRMIVRARGFVFIMHQISIMGAAFYTVIINKQFVHPWESSV